MARGTLSLKQTPKYHSCLLSKRSWLQLLWNTFHHMFPGILLYLVLATILPGVHGQNSGLITPPPKIGDKPIVSNGIVYYLITVPPHCMNPNVITYPGGGVVMGRKALMKSDSPHLIYGNIEIPPSACLYIEPGTVLRFGPGFGIIVNGTLIARGSDELGGRIIMTKDKGEDIKAPSGDWHYDARLSNGNTTQDGRLDLLYKGKWRGICTNYQNFTMIDVNVTCRHLGFLKGNFTYYSFARNLTEYMLWEKPGCLGSENSLFECPGANAMKIGAHICDGQQVVGFECEGLRPGLALDHWRGIEFLNSSTQMRYIDDNVYVEDAWSWLEYLDILYTGLDTFHGRTTELGIYYPKAAISASPFVPLMNNVTIMYGAYDAFNLTDIRGNIHIANCTIRKNRGYGIFIKAAVGQTLINMTQVTENWGDGIKFYVSNLTIHDFQRNFTWEKSFCRTPSLSFQSYPIFTYQDVIGPNGEKNFGSSCGKTYSTTKLKSVNVHFLLMERDPDASGFIIIREGSVYGTMVGTYPVSNGSFPQSVRSKTNTLHITFNYTLPSYLSAGSSCNTFPPCLRFLLRVTTSNGTEEEFSLQNSNVSANLGYGVNIQDIRSKVFINTSIVSDNNFGAGIRVYQGAGEIVINRTVVRNNADAGINITYSGGYQLLNNTQLIQNRGYGVITEYLRLNRTRIEFMQKIEIVRARFFMNEFIGLRMGNYCRDSQILVNESYFSFCKDEAIEYLSCNISTPYTTNFSVAFTTFSNNTRNAIFMKPLINTVGIITNCSFLNHTLGALYIDTGFDLLISKWYRNFAVNYSIFGNKFQLNSGRYAVNIRLTDESPLQQLYFKFNDLRNNFIQESFQYVNPRASANAVVVISSRNAYFQRNIMANPDSVREMSTHLTDPSAVINAKENYWNVEIVRQSDFEKIHLNIFDQDDRYNLAQIEYYPALKTDQVYQNYLSDDVPRYRWRFAARGFTIGGLLDEGNFIAQSGRTYYVDRDIFIFPSQIFTVEHGATLAFAPSIGMVVHGCLRADGQTSVNVDTVNFQLWKDPDMLPLENRTASVRLVGGVDLYEGRLEVLVDDEWGTVCNEGWLDINAALVCQQLGLIYSPLQGVATQRESANSSTRVLMSWVTCDEMDEDLAKCRSVRLPEVTCDHGQDVYLRCQDSNWAGITLPASRRLGQSCETQLREVSIRDAGLLDPASMSFTPALRIDYNFYQITSLTITNSLSDGVHVNYVHPYETSRLEYMHIHNNLGCGIITRYPRLQVFHSNITGSGKSGFLYDPFFSEYEALMVRSTIHETQRNFITETPTMSLTGGEMRYLLCPIGLAPESRDYFTEISVDSSIYRIVLQMLDYLPWLDNEEVIIYDSSRMGIAASTKKWKIPDDLVDFPIVSSSNILTIQMKVHGVRSGRLAFAIISQIYTSGAPILDTFVYNTTFLDNYQGIQTKHYNNPSNKRLEIFHRFGLETIRFDTINVLRSKMEAMYMPSVTKFTDDYIPTFEDMTIPERVATIRYYISLAVFADNQVGIRAEHNHVDFANNVWQWNISNVVMNNSQSGGLEIEVPRVNDPLQWKQHSVSVKNSVFKNNNNFAFTIAGYYTDVTVDNNKFDGNRCLVGLLSVTGMEKNLSVSNNDITNNIGRHMINIDILSHSEFSTPVTGILTKNNVQNNWYEGLDLPGYGNIPKTFAVAFKGVQQINANRNIFNNPRLGFELVAGITALSLENPIDVKANYWGKADYNGIKERIFDFDDWNNYAIAEFFPFLTNADVNSDLSGGTSVNPPLDLNNLGGRVTLNQILPRRSVPYIIERDLTVMPGATLFISAGTELQFRPNVGILVLGRLEARGLEFDRIRMRPVQTSTSGSSSAGRKKRAVVPSLTVRLRGDGENFTDAGFLELYNASTRTWNMMCDSQFNEKSAEVVCRQLGKETINVRVRFTYLYDFYFYGKPQYFLKEFWYESYYCRGDETSLTQCITRYNYNMLQCIKAANYTFISCGQRNLQQGDYWGNIRFASSSYQEQPLASDIGRQESIMEFLNIEGAGVLHGEKVGAIQTTYVTPTFSRINITQCADNGFDIVAPRSIMEMDNLNVSNNLGYAFNFLVLNGESSARESSFEPLVPSTIPYNVYGLVEICRMEKLITLSTRMILYYKYGPDSRDCMKIIRSTSPRNKVGLRFLQLNMFHEDFSLNVIEIYDGMTADDASLIADIKANTSQENILQLYQSSGDTLSVHLHASVSHWSYGFIAEIVTVPLSGLTYPDSNYRHTISTSIALRNQDGALQYKNVGEVNPSLFVDQCWMEGNGVAILNLTSPPVIDISLQGTLLFRFHSNFVSGNKGGMYLDLRTQTITTALRGNITNNVFSFGTNGEALNITGHYFQFLYIFQNYIYNYTTGDYRDVVHIRDVVVNYTYNYLDRNTGHYILTAYNSENQQSRQEYNRNGFQRNNSTALLESTIKIGKGKPLFQNNYCVNNENDFEMESYPKVDLNDAGYVNATYNWWGSEQPSYINGKVWDEADNSKLMKVVFLPARLDNRSVVEDKCPPGWKLDSGRCYRFMGGAVPYHRASNFCRSNEAFLAEGRGREGFYNYLLRLMRNENNPVDRVWVMSEVGSSRCSALENNYIVFEEDCWTILYPFICEKDPYIEPPVGLEASVRAMAIGIGAGIGGALILTIIILIILFCVKSKRREKERFERTASLRSSMRMSKSTLTMLSEGQSRRRINELDDYSQASSGGTKKSHDSMGINGSMASLHSRTGRIPTVDRGLSDRTGFDRRGRNPAQVTRSQQYDDDNASYGDSQGKESESDMDKKDFDDMEEDESYRTSDNEEEDISDEDGESAANMSIERVYQNQAHGLPLPPKVPGNAQRTYSQDNLYSSKDSIPSKKSLSSFSQPDTPTDSPAKPTFLAQLKKLPTPPPSPKLHGSDLNPQKRPYQQAPRPAHKPPAQQIRHSPAPSEASTGSKPAARPRMFGGNVNESPRATPLLSLNPANLPDYNSQAAPIPAKYPLETSHSTPSSYSKDSRAYEPFATQVNPQYLPNLPHYTLERPPSYEESDSMPNYRPQPYAYSLPEAHIPPEQDVMYVPRQQPASRPLYGSRDKLNDSRDRHGGSQEHLGGSRERLLSDRDRINNMPSLAAHSSDILYLNRNPKEGASSRSGAIETEI